MAGRLAEGPIRKIRIYGIQVRSVEEVEKFETKLKVDTFRDLCIFQECNIPLGEPGFTKCVERFVPLIPKSGWHGEVCQCCGMCGPEDTRQIRFTAVWILVARDIGEVKVVPVGVIVAAP